MHSDSEDKKKKKKKARSRVSWMQLGDGYHLYQHLRSFKKRCHCVTEALFLFLATKPSQWLCDPFTSPQIYKQNEYLVFMEIKFQI